MMKNRVFATAFAACMVMPMAALAQDDAPSADTVLATVNGVDVTLGQVIVAKTRLPQQFQALENDVLFPGLVDQLVQQTLLADSVEGLTTANRILLETEERSLLSAQAVDAVLAEGVTEEAIQATYDEAFGEAGGGPEYNASHILVETEDEALALIDELEAGADFAELARENSTGPSAPSGGNLGWFGPGRMVPAFEEAVVGLDVGAVSAPVQTQFGWHVIILNETRQAAAPTLEEVRAQIEQRVQQQVVDGHIAGLREGAEIDQVDLSNFDPAIINDLSIIGE